MKRCSKCKKEKELSEFSKDKQKIDYHASVCKQCIHLYYLTKNNTRNHPKDWTGILTKQFLLTEYIDNKKSPYVIGKQLNCLAQTVVYNLKKHGIVIRNKKESLKYKQPMTQEHKNNISKNHAKLFGSDNPNFGNHRFSKEKSYNWKGGSYLSKDGYWYVYAKTHPRKVAGAYIKRATFVMEQHIGRYLTKLEMVHHKNLDKSDDRLENLKLMTKSEHSKLHYKQTMKIDKSTGRLVGKV